MDSCWMMDPYFLTSWLIRRGKPMLVKPYERGEHGTCEKIILIGLL